MYIAELIYPGKRVVDVYGDNGETVRQIVALFSVIDHSVADAAVALHLYEEAQDAELKATESQRSRLRSGESMPTEEGLPFTDLSEPPEGATKDEKIDFYAARSHRELIERKRLEWAAGKTPISYRRRIAFLHARSFVFALDNIEKSINVICKKAGPPSKIKDIKKAWEDAFSNLQDIRDSAHHFEDRARRRGRGEKAITVQPVHNEMVNGGAALFLGSLLNDRYLMTLEDGTLGEIPITVGSLDQATRLVVDLIAAFSWEGPGRHEPS